MLIESRFEEVASTFFQLTEKQPYGGASLAIFDHGKPVIDIWAGEAAPGIPWSENTKSVVFSTSKGLLSIICHKLIQDGILDVDEKVSTYWPEFSAAGKEEITVAMVMRHRAGLSAVREDLTLEDVESIEPVERALASQEPIWIPDTGYLYHAGTIGHLLGKIIFNITGKRLNQHLQELLCKPLGVEAWYGIPADKEGEVALLKSDGNIPRGNFPTGSPEYWNERAMTYGKAFTSDVDSPTGGFNDPRIHKIEHAGAGGITNARSIAKIYSATVADTDGQRILNDQTIINAISRPNQGPNVFNDPAPYPIWSLGFEVANPAHSPVIGPRMFGHDGLGGQQGFADLDNRISFGYTTNWIPRVADGMARHRELTRVLAKVLQK